MPQGYKRSKTRLRTARGQALCWQSAVALQNELCHRQQRRRLKTVVTIELRLSVLDELCSDLRTVVRLRHQAMYKADSLCDLEMTVRVQVCLVGRHTS